MFAVLKRTPRLSAAACVLFLAGLACSFPALRPVTGEAPTSIPETPIEAGSSENDTDTPARTDAPTASATLTPDPTVADPIDAPQTIDLDSLAEFQFPTGVSTYRTTVEHSFSSDDETLGRISGEGSVNLDREAASLYQLSEGNASQQEDGATAESRIVDGVGGRLQAGRCVVSDFNHSFYKSAIPLTFFHSSIMPAEFLSGEAELAEGGLEVNGRPAVRYDLTPENLGGSEVAFVNLESLETGEIYLDAETNTLLRVVIEGFGRDSFINWEEPNQEGEIRYELNHHDFSQPVDISPLESCWFPPETDYPVPQSVIMFSGVLDDTSIMLHVESMLEDAVDFYITEMTAAGWDLTEDISFSEEDRLLEFSAGGIRVTVDIKMVPQPTSNEGETPTLHIFISQFEF